MSAQLIAFIIFALMLSGMALGSYLRLVLPDEHTQADSKDILMTSAATMGTLIALIIGLLVTSAKSTYDDTNASITQGWRENHHTRLLFVSIRTGSERIAGASASIDRRRD